MVTLFGEFLHELSPFTGRGLTHFHGENKHLPWAR